MKNCKENLKFVDLGKAQAQVNTLREWSESRTLVLLDYNTNEDITDTSTPLSHAAMIKAYIEGSNFNLEF